MRLARYIYIYRRDHACTLISLRAETRARRRGKGSPATKENAHRKNWMRRKGAAVFAWRRRFTWYHSVETQPRLATAGAQCSYLYKTRSQHNSNFLLLHGKRWGRRVCGRARLHALHARSHGAPHAEKRTKIPRCNSPFFSHLTIMKLEPTRYFNCRQSWSSNKLYCSWHDLRHITCAASSRINIR